MLFSCDMDVCKEGSGGCVVLPMTLTFDDSDGDTTSKLCGLPCVDGVDD